MPGELFISFFPFFVVVVVVVFFKLLLLFIFIIVLTGWGKIRHPGNSHHTLQQAKISPVSESDCKKKSKHLPSLQNYPITLL